MKDPLGNPNVVTVRCQLALAVYGNSFGNLGNPLVEKSALAMAGTPSIVGVCWWISGGVMHHESACKSEFQVRFLEWGPSSVALSVERETMKPSVEWWTKNVECAWVRAPPEEPYRQTWET